MSLGFWEGFDFSVEIGLSVRPKLNRKFLFKGGSSNQYVILKIFKRISQKLKTWSCVFDNLLDIRNWKDNVNVPEENHTHHINYRYFKILMHVYLLSGNICTNFSMTRYVFIGTKHCFSRGGGSGWDVFIVSSWRKILFKKHFSLLWFQILNLRGRRSGRPYPSPTLVQFISPNLQSYYPILLPSNGGYLALHFKITVNKIV